MRLGVIVEFIFISLVDDFRYAVKLFLEHRLAFKLLRKGHRTMVSEQTVFPTIINIVGIFFSYKQKRVVHEVVRGHELDVF